MTTPQRVDGLGRCRFERKEHRPVARFQALCGDLEVEGDARLVAHDQLGAATGRDLDDEAAGQVGLAVHRALGASYGIAASALVK